MINRLIALVNDHPYASQGPHELRYLQYSQGTFLRKVAMHPEYTSCMLGNVYIVHDTAKKKCCYVWRFIRRCVRMYSVESQALFFVVQKACRKMSKMSIYEPIREQISFLNLQPIAQYVAVPILSFNVCNFSKHPNTRRERALAHTHPPTHPIAEALLLSCY